MQISFLLLRLSLSLSSLWMVCTFEGSTATLYEASRDRVANLDATIMVVAAEVCCVVVFVSACS